MIDINDDLMTQMSVFDVFTQSQESLEDAKRKSASESNAKTQYFQMSKDDTYLIRILPLAPEIGPDGRPILPMKRKGYEYPLRDLFLKIDTVDKKGKKGTKVVPVCHASLAFPGIENDLIDLYARIACDMNADDEDFCKKIKSNSFSGGLKFNAKRCMYVLDTNDRGKGLQILQLSYSQYKDLEDAKLNMWSRLAAKGGNVPCPISSVKGAFPISIRRKTENKKVSYSIGIDTLSGTDELSQSELQLLLDAPRLPEATYIYRRFHLEASIEYLRQLDKQYNLNVMETQEIADCIDQIKMRLAPDDNSHFSVSSDGADNSNDSVVTIEKLWGMYDELEKDGLNDRSEEGQNLRSLIREFIEANDLDIRVDRKKSNYDVLSEIDGVLDANASDNDEEDDDEEADFNNTPVNEPDVDEEDDDEEDNEPVNLRNTRNDDTNEPAVRTRRASRGVRRR